MTTEFKIWTDLKHANVLPFVGYIMRGDLPCFVSEWMDNGSVRDYLTKFPDADIYPLVNNPPSIARDRPNCVRSHRF